MSIALVLNEGKGTLNKFIPNKKLRPLQELGATPPLMTGIIEMPLVGMNKSMKIRTWLWLYQDKNHRPYYRLTIGGIPATLFPEKEKRSPAAPDYSGHAGFNDELRIVAWIKTGPKGDFLSVAISQKKAKDGIEGPSIAVVFAEGEGTLNDFVANEDLPPLSRPPAKSGLLEFTTANGEKLKIRSAFWKESAKIRGKDTEFFSGSVAGIPISLFAVKSKKEGGPDYTGTMGFNKELRTEATVASGVNGEFWRIAVSPKKAADKAAESGANEAGTDQAATADDLAEAAPASADMNDYAFL